MILKDETKKKKKDGENTEKCEIKGTPIKRIREYRKKGRKGRRMKGREE